VKRIHSSTLSRQFHLASAGVKAGWSLTKGHIETSWISTADQREAARLNAMKKSAQQWAQEIGQLKGGIVKAGQILATYGDYCLPAPLAQALHHLESETEPLCWAAISPLLDGALQNKRAELIIDPAAIAAASLSQVHKARIKRNNQVICLKILYPNIEKSLVSDFSVLKKSLLLLMARKQRKNLSQQLDDIIFVLLDEIDIKKEAQKIQRWNALLAGDFRYIVPVVDEQYTSETILAMSFEHGVSQNDSSVLALPQARRNQLAANMLELLLTEILVWGEMQTDPHAGNYRIRIADNSDEKDSIVLLDFGSVRAIEGDLLQALQKMLLAAYFDDEPLLRKAMIDAGFLSIDAPEIVQAAFCEVLMGMIEPLNYKRRVEKGEDIPSYAMDSQGNYCWAAAKLPKRMGKLAVYSAFSRHFVFPGIDFLLVARKLAGVYTFIATLDAKFDGSVVMEKVISTMRDATNSAQSSSVRVSKSAHTGK